MATNNDYFKTFCTISKAFGSTWESDELLSLIVKSAVETMDAKAACLFLADREKDSYVEKAQYGLSENYRHANPVKARRIEEVLVKEKYIAVYDATKDEQVENHESKKKEGIASLLVVPVIVNDKMIGVLSLYTGTHRNFAQEEVDFLTSLAEQGGIALEQTRLIERIRDNTKIFHQMASNINASLNIKEILHNLTETLCTTLDMTGVSIRLINKESGDMPIVASHGLSDDFLYKEKGSIQKSAEQTLEGSTVVIEDLTEDKRVQNRSEAENEGVRSALFVPIKSKDEVVGIMRLFSNVKQHFTEDTINLVNALAEQGGLAIQNASMLLMLQEDNRNLEQDMWAHKSWF